MFSVEELCKKITNSICKDLNYDNEKIAVVNYGVFAFIQMGVSIFSVIIFGLIFNVLIEGLIISFAMSILRKSSGGVHADTPGKCAVVGAILSILGGHFSKIISTNNHINIIFIGFIVFSWSYIIIKKYAPVDSLAKPIKTEKKRKRLKKNSILILFIYFIIALVGIFMFKVSNEYKYETYVFCIYFAIILQVFSLTKIGSRILSKI